MLSYDEAVERIRDAVGKEAAAKFTVGDTALDQCPMGADEAHNGMSGVLAALERDTGVPVRTLEDRRFVASRIPLTARAVRVPWQVYKAIARLNETDRQRLVLLVQEQPVPLRPRPGGAPYTRWCVNAVRAELNLPPTNATNAVVAVDYASPEEKVEIFQTLTQDEHIVEEASDYTSPTAQALGQLEVASSHRAAQRTEEHYANDPVIQASDAQRALLDLATALREFADRIDRILPACQAIPSGLNDAFGHDIFLTAALDRALDAMRRTAYLITTGRTDLDAFLGEVLHSERRD